MVNFNKFSSENTAIFSTIFCLKMTIVSLKCVSCHSNQEWRSIGVDTVVQMLKMPLGSSYLVSARILI